MSPKAANRKGILMRSKVLFLTASISLCVLACGKDPEVAKREYMKSGDALLAAGKVNEAAIAYRNAIQQDPQYGEARFKLGKILEQSGNTLAAFREFQRAADLMPSNADAQLQAAAFNIAAQQYEDAKTRMERLLQNQPTNMHAQLMLANSLAGLKLMDAAIAAIESAIKSHPNESVLYANHGAFLMTANRRDEAERSYLKAVEVDPRSPRARTELAVFQWRTGKTEQAEASLKEALALDAQNLEANRVLSELYISTNRRAAAEAPLKVIAATGDSTSRFALVEYYIAGKRYPEALAELETFETQAPAPGQMNAVLKARVHKAEILHWQDRNVEAHAALDAVLAKDPNNVDALSVRAKILVAERKFDRALEAAESAVAIDGTVADAHLTLGRIHQGLGHVDKAIAAFNEVLRLSPTSVPAQLELSRAYLRGGRSQEALQLAQSVLAKQPRNPEALLLQSRALLQAGNVSAAERPTSALMRDHPEVAAVHLQVGDLQRQKKDNVAARAAYERALAIDPLNARALTSLAALDFSLGRAADARARVDAALSKQPESPALLMLAGGVYAQLRDYASAEKALRKAVELEPSNPNLYAMLGAIYRDQGQTDRAIAEFDRLVRKSSKPAAVQTLIGTLLESQQRFDEAKKRYEEALQLDPNAPVAANNLAWLIAERGGNLDVALQLAQKAKAGRPESAEISDTLGWVFYKKGLFSQAVTALAESVAKKPEVAVFQYHLGLSYAKAGRAGLARETLNTALALDPKSPQAAEARAELSRLPPGS
jgi:tetratricopeptide (TPR) repeat protein